jgi:DNA-binding response OmpR family regulator
MKMIRWARGDDSATPDSDTPAARVLLIDDDEDEYKLLRSAMRDMRSGRYDLDWTPIFEDAVERMRRNSHDLYIVDYNLGGRSGVEVIRQARALGCERPAIMMTGQGSQTIDEAALEAGATDFVEKGRGSAAVLERAMRYVLSQAATADALRRSLRQVSGLEALGRLLTEQGPTPEALDQVVRLIDEEFGMPRSSLFLIEDGVLYLVAYRGYEMPARAIDANSGRLATLIRSGRSQIVGNISIDPAARTVDDPMELCVPLVAEGTCFGLLNVAVPAQAETNDSFSQPMRVLADRLAVALALNRAIGSRSFLRPVSQPAPTQPQAGQRAG